MDDRISHLMKENSKLKDEISKKSLSTMPSGQSTTSNKLRSRSYQKLSGVSSEDQIKV